MDPVTLAAAAIAAVQPYLVALAKDVAKGAAGGAGKSVWDWVKGKLTSEAGKEAVKDLESAPADDLNRKATEAALSKVLRSDSGALSELAQLLEKAGITLSQSANITGDHNIVGQSAAGSNVSINTGHASRAGSKGPST